MKAGADLFQANADSAETPAKTPMKVQKTEMQARRRLDLDDLTHLPCLGMVGQKSIQ